MTQFIMINIQSTFKQSFEAIGDGDVPTGKLRNRVSSVRGGSYKIYDIALSAYLSVDPQSSR